MSVDIHDLWVQLVIAWTGALCLLLLASILLRSAALMRLTGYLSALSTIPAGVAVVALGIREDLPLLVRCVLIALGVGIVIAGSAATSLTWPKAAE